MKELKKIPDILSLICLTIFMTTPLYSLEDADELYRKGRFSEAEELYQKADMDNPKDLRYRYNRGCAAYQKSDYKSAAAAFSSVSKRSRDKGNKEMLFKSSYNLGNIAFMQNDFSTAIDLYKMAIYYKPENKDAKYNLELALMRLSQSEENDQNKDGQNKDDSKNKKQNKSGKEKQGDKGNNQGQEGENESDNNQGETGKSEMEDDKKDLSGKLQAANPQEEESLPDMQPTAAALLDKKKAEALLDNIKENRSKFFRFQVPQDKKDGVNSGMDW